MKKRVSYIGALVALITILVGIITLLFSKNLSKIEIGKNLKTIKSTKNNVTTIDLTNIGSNINIEHEHIFKTMYDETKHWNQCIICGEKVNEINHTLTTTWALRI